MSASGRFVVVTAGGTGGHVFPAEALAAELRARGCRLALITDRRGGVFGGSLADVETYHVRAGGLAGRSLLGRVRGVAELVVGTFQARRLLAELRPDAVVGFGGYASVPTMLAATRGGYRTALHEQNAVLGRANRLLARRVERIGCSFPQIQGLPGHAVAKLVHTGMPVRSAVTAARNRSYPRLDGQCPLHLLVMGGSQGARVLSEVLPRAMALLEPPLRQRLRIAQQCRPEDLDEARRLYAETGVTAELATFFSDVPERLAACHLLVARAGASTVAEATAVGRPSILVPYPHATDDHQTANAHAVAEVGGGWLMPQEHFTPESLAIRLGSLFELPATLEKAAACALAAGRPDAARALADMVFELLPANGNHLGQERRAAA